MSISIVISDTVRFKVSGVINDAAGKPQPFDFWLTCLRLQDTAAVREFQEGIVQSDSKTPITDALADVAQDWSGPKDGAGQALAFGDENLRTLLNLPGMASLVHATYLREVGAKEKN